MREQSSRSANSRGKIGPKDSMPGRGLIVLVTDGPIQDGCSLVLSYQTHRIAPELPRTLLYSESNLASWLNCVVAARYAPFRPRG
jgi:hypothetical protein